MLEPETRATFVAHPQVITQEMGAELVLLHLGSDCFFELNRTGSRFWTLLTQGVTPGEIRNQMLAEFDVAADQLEREIGDLLEQLKQRELIVPATRTMP
jgi:hypothetical protein